MKELYANGMPSWNKGLTKETSEKVLKQSNSLKEHFQDNPHPKGSLGKSHSLETREKMSLDRRGAKNANWKGGLTRIKRGIKRSPNYLQWRKAVLERDNHICQNCGEVKANHAHHILPFRDNPLFRFDIENGITFCEKCHMNYHWNGEKN